MISKIESSLFRLISDIFSDYGISTTFKYDDNLDLLNEYRKSPRLRITHSNLLSDLMSSYDQEVHSIDNKVLHNLGLFTRSPIRKSDKFGNNTNIEFYSMMDDGNLSIRNANLVDIDYDCKILCDNHETTDLLEIIFLNRFSNRTITLSIDYLFDNNEQLTDVPYTLEFDNIANIGRVGNSNMRELAFSFKLSGLVFMPFTTDDRLLESIRISIHVMGPLVSPKYENATDANHYRTYIYDIVR